MENRRVRKQKKYKMVCVLYRLDFEEVEDKNVHYWIIESTQDDRGLALKEVKDRIYDINTQIPNKFVIGVAGYYTGELKAKITHINDFDLTLVKHKIKEVTKQWDS